MQYASTRFPTGMASGMAAVMAFVLLLVVLPVGSAAQTRLAWNFDDNPELTLRFEQKTTAKTSLGSGSLDTSLEMVMDMDWKVEGTNDNGSARVTQTIRRLTLKMKPAGGEAISYDSERETQDSDAANQIARSMNRLLNAPMQLTIDTTGEILSVQLPPETAAALNSAAPAATRGKAITVEEIEQLLGQASIVLPKMPVEPRAKWSNIRRAASPLGKLKFTSDYEFEGAHPDGGQIVSFSTTIEFPAGSPLKILEQKQEGQIRFDAVAGRLLDSSITQRLKTQTKSGAKIQTDAQSTLRLTVEAK